METIRDGHFIPASTHLEQMYVRLIIKYKENPLTDDMIGLRSIIEKLKNNEKNALSRSKEA